MVRCWIVLLLVFWAGLVRAQEFAIINDPDGYVNVRKTKDIKSQIVGKLYDGNIFYYNWDTKADKWYSIYFSPCNFVLYPEGKAIAPPRTYLQGFVSANRLTFLDELPHLKLSSKNRKLSPYAATVSWDSTTLVVHSKRFQKSIHRLQGSGRVPAMTIDGKHFYGTDGNIPTTQLSEVTLTIGQNKIALPAKAIADLYNPSLENWNLYRDKKDNIYIMSNNSDGAGGYDLVFVIANGKFVARYIDQP